MKLVGANPAPQIEGLEQLPGTSNYFTGNDPAGWRTDVSTYARVRYREIYPGVDLIFYGKSRQLEYDLIVAPGADTEAIKMSLEGMSKRGLNRHGDLVLQGRAGRVLLRKPVVYQESEEGRREVAGRYVLKGKNEVGFAVAAYDASRPLVIDPVITYSTYLGGGTDD